MARIKQGVLGGFSGSIGSVVGTSWKGIAVMKAKPLSVANPRTPLQVNARLKFASAVEVAKELLPNSIKPLLDRSAVRQSGYNRFMSLNKQAFNETGFYQPTLLITSVGNLAAGSELAGSVQTA